MTTRGPPPTAFALDLPPSWCALDLTHPQWVRGLADVLAQIVDHPDLAPFAAPIGEALHARARLLADAGAAWMLMFRSGAAEAPTVIGGIVSRPGTSGGLSGLRGALTGAGWSCWDVSVFVTPGLRARRSLRIPGLGAAQVTEELIVVPAAASTTSLAFAWVGGWPGGDNPSDVGVAPVGTEDAGRPPTSRLSQAVDELLAGLAPVPAEST